ncbi:hypothetical protein SAMN05428975_1040 [Mucilaginibacter sp. OK268]|nr:hypothetical protein SAMN05428975_1040 [Mucilaginibacter sp. OK268]
MQVGLGNKISAIYKSQFRFGQTNNYQLLFLNLSPAASDTLPSKKRYQNNID